MVSPRLPALSISEPCSWCWRGLLEPLTRCALGSLESSCLLGVQGSGGVKQNDGCNGCDVGSSRAASARFRIIISVSMNGIQQQPFDTFGVLQSPCAQNNGTPTTFHDSLFVADAAGYLGRSREWLEHANTTAGHHRARSEEGEWAGGVWGVTTCVPARDMHI